MNKAELRKLYIEKRKSFAAFKTQYDEKIYNNFIKSDDYAEFDGILCYVSTEIEVDTDRIITKAFEDGKTVAVPKCVCGTNIMHFYEIRSFDDLEKGFFGIREPKTDEEITDFENYLCIVPALSIDKNGYRLGYGKGFYDRFLSENNVKTIGLCYKDFLTDNLPHEEHDIKIQVIVTEDEIHENRR